MDRHQLNNQTARFSFSSGGACCLFRTKNNTLRLLSNAGLVCSCFLAAFCVKVNPDSQKSLILEA